MISRNKKEAFLHPIRTLFQSDSSERNDERLTFETSIRKRNIFDPTKVSELIKFEQNEAALDGKQIFSIAMLELWCRIYIDKEIGWT